MENATAIEDSLKQIAELAPVVSANHEALETARAQERAALASLLEKALNLVRPAIRALSSRIKMSSYTSSVNGGGYVERSTWYPDLKGIHVAGEYEEVPDETGNSGHYKGTKLWLSTADWVETECAGTWSKWQGAPNEWKADLNSRSTIEVVRNWDVPAILRELADSLQRDVKGNRVKSAEAAMARAKKAEAIVQLLK